MRLLMMLALTFLIMYGAAQQHEGTIRTKISEGQTGLPDATVELLRAPDSILVKTSLSDKDGNVWFNQVPAGDYLLRITAIGFTTLVSQPFSISQNQEGLELPSLQMQRQPSQNLQGVTVTARKPFIQKLHDRIVVNIDNSIMNAGSSAMDALERSPGVTIDQNDIISLRGRQGVIIMIDGKPTPMSGADLATYLRGLPVNAIERIDIITNPSAKYDAAGNSGIIDIRMKKDQRLGTNGTINAGYGQGIYPKANTGLTWNYRNKSMNIFGNYNYAYREHLNNLIINRNFYENGVFMGSDNKDNYAWMPVNNHSARLGADFFPSKKTIIGFVVNSGFTDFRRRATIETTVNDIYYQPDFRFVSLGTNNDDSRNVVANINFKHNFDSTGREISADVDYGNFNSRSITRTASSFYNLNGTPKSDDDILDGDQAGELSFRTGKVDYVHPFRNKTRLEAGIKTSLVSSDNDARFYNVLPGGPVVDDTKTNRFFYKEYNHAGYLNISREFNKFNLQAGLRAEQTEIETRQVKGNLRFEDDYIRFFPSVFFNYHLKEDQTLGVSVSRRIDRPSYSQLNPFLFQIDATIYGTGNPVLKPQMTWSYEMSYTLRNMSFSLGYSHTTDPQNMVLSKILDVIPNFEIKPGQDSNITVQIPVNLTSSDYVGLSASVPVRITKWWNSVNSMDAFYNHFNGNLGGTPLNSGAPAVSIRTNQNFSFKKGWSAEMNGNFWSGGRSGYMVSKAQWGMGLGVQKTALKGKGTFRLNATDIFWTNRPRARVEYKGSYIENWHAYRESRVVNLSFTYRFGNSKVQQARKRTTASEEERRRAGG